MISSPSTLYNLSSARCQQLEHHHDILNLLSEFSKGSDDILNQLSTLSMRDYSLRLV